MTGERLALIVIGCLGASFTAVVAAVFTASAYAGIPVVREYFKGAGLSDGVAFELTAGAIALGVLFLLRGAWLEVKQWTGRD